MESKNTNFKKVSEKEENQESINQSKDSNFFLDNVVGISCVSPIAERFKALIESRKEQPYDWYKELGLDKADASRIRRGLMIPNEYWRIKIAGYFGIDSTVIRKVAEIVSADKLNKGDKNDDK